LRRLRLLLEHEPRIGLREDGIFFPLRSNPRRVTDLEIEPSVTCEDQREVQFPVQEPLFLRDVAHRAQPREVLLRVGLFHAHEVLQVLLELLELVQRLQLIDERALRNIAHAEHRFQEVEPVVQVLERDLRPPLWNLRLPPALPEAERLCQNLLGLRFALLGGVQIVQRQLFTPEGEQWQTLVVLRFTLRWRNFRGFCVFQGLRRRPPVLGRGHLLTDDRNPVQQFAHAVHTVDDRTPAVLVVRAVQQIYLVHRPEPQGAPSVQNLLQTPVRSTGSFEEILVDLLLGNGPLRALEERVLGISLLCAPDIDPSSDLILGDLHALDDERPQELRLPGGITQSGEL